jgi:hypothetical protein
VFTDFFFLLRFYKVREVFPMFELTVDGLTAATRKLIVRY